MKKIVFGITDLEIGGAEKVLVDIVNRLKDEYEITIFTIYGKGTLETSVNPNINIISITNKSFSCIHPFKKKLYSLLFSFDFLLKFAYEKHIKDKFDTEVAFLEGPITSLFAVKNKDVRKIAWVHTNLSKHVTNPIRKAQYQKDYQSYEQVIFCSSDALNGFEKTYKVNNTRVVYNYLDTINIIKKSVEPITEVFDEYTPNFVSVCRLVKPKALDRLIRVSKRLKDKNLHHRIYIVGEGEERNNLEELIKLNNLQDTFILLGQRDNPYPYMKAANYFLLTSEYEGYGMVLVEAMMLNKDIMITNTGATEAVNGYGHSLVVENNEDAIYEGMKALITKKHHFSDKIELSYNPDQIIEEIKSIL